jgi:hypothetical protein
MDGFMFVVLQSDYHSQAYDAVEAFAWSSAVLHAVARVAFPCGVDAAVLKPLRCASKAVFSEPSTCGALAAILVKHASYFLIYSSHSATPTESPAGAVLAVAVFAGAVVFVAVLVTVAVFDLLAVAVFDAVFVAPPQAAKKIAAPHRSTATKSKLVLNFILFVLVEF